MTIRVQLGGHSEEFVQEQLTSGRYSDVADVVRDALRLMEQRDQALSLHSEALAQQIEVGYRSLQEGRHEDGEAFFAELEAELDQIDRRTP